MELPLTTQGNKYVLVFQDLFIKWPMVYPLPDQKTERIVKMLVEEVIIPFFGVPEALLSDRGTNLLPNLMFDVCKLLGIQKLNTTAYHPQCDGMVERFNCTLKSMLRKHAATLGNQWDRYLKGVLWAYRNTPHESTGEKPSFLLFGLDCRSPTKAALLPPRELKATNVSDYREQLMLSLSSAPKLAGETLKKAQKRYKKGYDKHCRRTCVDIGDWILIKFPQEESGKNLKLSQPWHGPYRVVSHSDTGVVASKVYFPEEECINVHLTSTSLCPVGLPNGFYWYGRRQSSNSRPYPEWVDAVCWPNAVPTLHPEVNSDERSGPTVGDNDGAPEDRDPTLFNHQEDNSGNEQHGESQASSVNGDINHNREINTNRYSLRKVIKTPQRFRT